MSYGSSAIRTLRRHDYVFDVTDVSVDDREVLSVQFNSKVLPTPIRDSDRYEIREVWVGVYPSWWLRWGASKFAMRHGIGTSAIAAEIEVIEE